MEQKTITVVYVVISGGNDVYFEMAWASAWSLKKFNPEAHVLVLTDDETIDNLSSEAKTESVGCIDELRPVSFDGKYTNKEKSRWIKTNLRSLVDGVFLFIDTDTIITGSLLPLFDVECRDIGMALDNNCHSSEIGNYPIFHNMYVTPLRQIFGDTYRQETDVYNSGVILIKDTQCAADFFNAWHANWMVSRSKGEPRDQLSLVKTIQDMPSVVAELPGIYNCQIRNSVKYFYDAAVLHTFTSQKKSTISPIFDNEMYWEIKEKGCITEHVKYILVNCKRLFSSPSIIEDKRNMLIRFEPAYILFIDCLFATDGIRKKIYEAINFFSRAIIWALRHIK